MSKKYWRYFYRTAGVITVALLVLGGVQVSQNLNANKNYIDNVLNPVLYPQSQPKNPEKQLGKNYCPPGKENSKDCKLYIICNDPSCIKKNENDSGDN